jgi:hypothetical protein
VTPSIYIENMSQTRIIVHFQTREAKENEEERQTYEIGDHRN